MAAGPLATVGKALRLRHWLVWGFAGVGAALALGAASVRTPTYQATTLLRVDESQSVSQGFDIAIQADQYLQQRYISMATSQAVLTRVCAQEAAAAVPATSPAPPQPAQPAQPTPGAAASPGTVSGCTPTLLSKQVNAVSTKATGEVAITATRGSPEAAARIANEVASAILAENQAYVTNSLAPQRQLLQSKVDQLNQQMGATQQAIQAANAAKLPDSAQLAQFNLLQNQYQSTYGRLQDLDVMQTRLISGLTIEQAAIPPTKPSDPDAVRYVLVGVVGGLAVGLMLALLAERFRERILDGAELAEVTGSELVLAVDYREAAVVIGSYGLLAPDDVGEGGSGAQLLLVAASPDVPVDDLAMDLAEAAASEHRRVLVVPSGPGRALREVNDRGTGRLLQPRPRPPGPRDADLTIRCASPLARPSMWLKPSAGPAILVATRHRTRFGDARRTAELLRRLGLEPVATLLLTRTGQRPPKRRLPADVGDVEGSAPRHEAPESEASA
jgi:capsular polysaccharide biosynthesis protein